jgi:hypothetical protein
MTWDQEYPLGLDPGLVSERASRLERLLFPRVSRLSWDERVQEAIDYRVRKIMRHYGDAPTDEEKAVKDAASEVVARVQRKETR